MGRTCSTHGEKTAFEVLMEGQKEIDTGRPRCMWANNIKMELRDRLGWYGLD
jgi:hypothetical protein